MTGLPAAQRTPWLVGAWWLGWAGLAALTACGAAALVPSDGRPEWLVGEDLAVAAVLSLATASLLGWGCVQMGQQRLRRLLGAPLGALVLAVLPLACAATSAAVGAGLLSPEPRVVLIARWVPPALLALSLGAFLAWRTRPRSKIRLGRGLWFAALATPYALLVAVSAFEIPVPWLHDARADTFEAIGGWSVALQLALAYVAGETPTSG